MLLTHGLKGSVGVDGVPCDVWGKFALGAVIKTDGSFVVLVHHVEFAEVERGELEGGEVETHLMLSLQS